MIDLLCEVVYVLIEEFKKVGICIVMIIGDYKIMV